MRGSGLGAPMFLLSRHPKSPSAATVLSKYVGSGVWRMAEPELVGIVEGTFELEIDIFIRVAF